MPCGSCAEKRRQREAAQAAARAEQDRLRQERAAARAAKQQGK